MNFLRLSFFLTFLLFYSCSEDAPADGNAPEAEPSATEERSVEKEMPVADLPAMEPVLLTGVQTEWMWRGRGITVVDSVLSVPGLAVEKKDGKLLFRIVGDIGPVNVVTLFTPEGRVDLLVRDAGSVPVPFRLKDEGYEEVRVVGDMNNWDASRGLMVKRGRVWELIFPLPPGSYRYRFVVDGKPLADPKNPNKEKDEAGEVVSVYEVKAPGGKQRKELPTVELAEQDGTFLRLHLPEGGAVIALLNNRQLPVKVQGKEAWVELPQNAKGSLRIYVQNEAGLGEPLVLEL